MEEETRRRWFKGLGFLVLAVAVVLSGASSSFEQTSAKKTPPTNSVPPTISGTPQAGQTVSADPGAWSGSQPIRFSYRWRRCDSSGAGCADIAGATNQTYAVVAADVGATLRVAVTGSNSGGSSTAVSQATAVVPAAPATPPSNTSAPTIGGTPQAGQTVSADPGAWSGTAPIGYAYGWRRCDSSGAGCADIAGAANQAYAVVAADVGATLRVAVTGSNSGGSSTAVSQATAVVTAAPATPPSNTSAPTIGGTPQAGQTVSADPGAWSGTAPISYAYQWQRCTDGGGGYAPAVMADSPLGYWRLGEASGTVAADSSPYGRAGTYVNNPTLGATGALAGDANTAVGFDGVSQKVNIPDDTGVRLNGSFSIEFWAKLGAFANTWPGILRKGDSFTGATGYLIWYSSDLRPIFKRAGIDGEKVTAAGALSTSTYKHYVLTYDAAAGILRWYVNGAPDSTYSGLSYPTNVDSSLVALGRGDQFGNEFLDDVAFYAYPLSSSQVSAHYSAGTSASSGGCTDIGGATGRTYAVADADVGATLRVAVTGSNSGGSSTAASQQTATVTAAAASPPSNTAAPTISGTPRAGQTLTAASGTWSGTQPIALTYQWQRCDTFLTCGNVVGAAAQTYTLGAADVGSTMRVAVTGTNSAGSSTEISAATAVVESASSDPVIVSAGDIACDPARSDYNGGNGTPTTCHMKATAALISAIDPTAVLALGDNAYECAPLSVFQQSYDPSWGGSKSITHPVVGNHEYETDSNSVSPFTACDNTGTAQGYFDYFGAAAGDRTKGYYSYDIGSWHIIALNSECSHVGGCGVGSTQEQWLKADLAAHPAICTLAYWHEPRWSSGVQGNLAAYDPFWKDLYNAGAEIVLVAHMHFYERFAPQDPAGSLDTALGIREFTVGTGGKSLVGLSTIQPNSEVRNTSTYGVLELTLHANSYDWQFVPESGQSFTDSGTTQCH